MASHNFAGLGMAVHWDLRLQTGLASDMGMPVRPAVGSEEGHLGERRVLVTRIVVVVAAVALLFAA